MFRYYLNIESLSKLYSNRKSFQSRCNFITNRYLDLFIYYIVLKLFIL